MSTTFSKGDLVEVLKDPYDLDIPVGTEGKIMRGAEEGTGEAFVGIKFKNGVKCKAWMVVDGDGDQTIVKKRKPATVNPHRVSCMADDKRMADMELDTPRQCGGHLQVVVPNPGRKLIRHLGIPGWMQFYTAGDFTCRRCLFNLPADWYLVEEVGENETIIARQEDTDRCVSVSNRDDGMAQAEVLN